MYHVLYVPFANTPTLKKHGNKAAISTFMSTASHANAENVGTGEYKDMHEEIVRWVQSVEKHALVPAIVTGPPKALTNGDVNEDK